MNKACQVLDSIEPLYVIEGAGVRLKRLFSPRVTNLYDPFLLFDHFAFNQPIEAAAVGFPMHPHRGIETVTYMLVGKVDHRDSLENQGQIGPGDVQWMTAGGGILHEEMPRIGSDRALTGFQLWVNLPAAQKMNCPRYQGVSASEIPVPEGKGWSAHVIAGQVGNIRGPVVGIAADPIYLDVCVEAGSEFVQPVPRTHTLLAYIFEGQGQFGDQLISSAKMIVLGGGNNVRVLTQDTAVRFILMAGEPLKEQIAPYGPFVMNTPEEIQQALADLRNGTFVRDCL
jgi:redox-sensitive bicupin YhaK (pirin superfamily)